jgi:hypothetical protein
MLGAWVVGVTLAGCGLGVWNTAMTTSTCIWFVTAAFVFLPKLTDVSDDEHFLRKRAVEAMSVPVVVGGLLTIAPPNFLIELLLQPVVFLLVSMSVVAAKQKDLAQVKRLVDGLLGLLGLALVAREVARACADWGSLNKHQLLLQLVLPMWLSLAALPFVYFAGVWAAYEHAFVRIELGAPTSTGPGIRRLALAFAFGLNARELRLFIDRSRWRVSRATSFHEVRALVSEFRQQTERADSAAA